jgi:N-acetylmuramoyl-L-alanine amidase
MPEIINSLLHSKNFSVGRKGSYPIDTIVVHVMEGSEESANSWFEDEASDVSSNYGIAKDGRIEMYVKEEDTAWAQGRVNKPTAKAVLARPDANPNWYCISIEHEGSGNEPLTPEQKASSVWLIQDISRRRSIPIDRDHVIGHHEIFNPKTCPGKIDVTELVQLAKGIQPGTTVIANPPRIVYSPSLRDYLVVTRYVSDDEWYFYPMKELIRGSRAGAKLSAMPLKPIA